MMAGGQEETAMSRGQHHDDERFPERDNPAIGVHVPSLGPTLVFATVNTKDRTPWLANDRVHTALRALWLSSRAWMVGTYVVMPDHVHFIAAPGEPDTEFEVWVKYWKRLLSQSMQADAGKWQPRAWHTRIRTAAQFREKCDYMQDNPVRRGLVARAEDWPYAGDIHRVYWS
jgi:putative transposase